MISGLNLERPEKNLDAPARLYKAEVLTDVELSERLPAMVRFRNLLVHRYWEVKPELVYRILHEHLDDIRLLRPRSRMHHIKVGGCDLNFIGARIHGLLIEVPGLS